MRSAFRFLAVCASLAYALLLASAPVLAQVGAPQSPDAAISAELDGKIQRLSESLDQTRSELAQSREEIKELRALLEQVIQTTGANAIRNPAASAATPAQTGENASAQTAAEQPAAHITEDDWQ